MRIPIAAAMTMLFVSPLFADNVLHPGTPVLDRPTLTAVGVQLPITGDDNFNATISVRYRPTGSVTWRQALPLFRVHPEATVLWTVAPQFAGSIFDLHPGTSYDIELHAIDPDGPVDQTFILTSVTRTVPAGPAAPRVRNVNDAPSFISAIASAQPGDVIQLADGVYPIASLYVFATGTADNPIVIRGTSEDNTILDGGNCTDCNVIEIYGSYVHIEKLSIRNALRAVRFQTEGSQGNVVRYVHVYNTILGIHGRANQKDFYIADNIVEGRLFWPHTYATDGPAHTNDDGIVVAGFGHVVCHNRITGYADALQINQEGSRAIDFYGNEVLYTFDDGIELDTSEGNVRCIRNRFSNTLDTISLQPILGGPAYVVRNVVVNVAGEQMKFHAFGSTPPQEPNGILAYHNTFVSPYGEFITCTPAASHHFWLQNNLLVGPSSLRNQALQFCGPIDDGHFDYNGYWPDGGFSFNLPVAGGFAFYNFPNFAAMQGGGLETHGTLLSGVILASGLIGPASFATMFFAPQDVTLAPGSAAIDRGLILPNINDGFTGVAPDLGAAEIGCPLPLYGPRPPGVDENNEPFGCAPATSIGPSLNITKTHTGDFAQGQQHATYTVIVSNAANAASTSGAVTVTETAPAGLTLMSMSGTGWTCPGTASNNCTRSDVLNGGASYPPITVTVNVAANATSPQVNSVAVSGAGSVTASATDLTNVIPPGSDLAQGKAASQSSTYGPSTGASNAVDGNTDGNFLHGSVTHTSLDANAWWQVDLGTSAAVGAISIWNRTDCCPERLNDYWVFVSSTPFGPFDTPATLQNRAGTWNSHQTGYPNPSTTITVNAQGRYVRVQLSGTNYLSLAEVQVFGTALPNLAQGKTATQSSTYGPAVASNAVDGNTDGSFSDGSITHTGLDSTAWWQVDLDTSATVSSISIWNRTDCCSDRLSDYWVFVSDTPFGPSDTPTTLQNRAGTWSSHQTGYPNPSTMITVNAQGRYVRVQLSGTNYLSLAEVQVFGTSLPNVAQGKTATQSSTYSSGTGAANAVDGNTDGNFSHGSITHTGLDSTAWWQVDLGTSPTISSISIWNRTDCCSDRLSDYWVFISNTPFGPSDTPATLQNRAGTWSSHQTSFPNPSTTITVNVQGRYVRIQLSGTNYLSLAEVQVYGQ